MRTIRTLVAALAIAVLGVTAAYARPVDARLAPPGAAQKDMHASFAIAAAKSQDLRSPDARDAQLNRRAAVLIPPDAVRDAAPATQANAVPTAPASKPAAKPVVVHADPGVDWTSIAIGVGASLLAMTVLLALTTRRARPRVTA
jgi:hypothetical protein